MEMVLAQILSRDVKPEKGPRGQLQLLKECDLCLFCGMCRLLAFFYFEKGKKISYKLVCYFLKMLYLELQLALK